MFTPESAVDTFKDILSDSVRALEREVSYAQSQLERMSDARMPRFNRDEFVRARGEFVSTIADTAAFIRSGRAAVQFLSVSPGLSDYDQEFADAIGEYDAEIKKMSAVFADITADIRAAYF